MIIIHINKGKRALNTFCFGFSIRTIEKWEQGIRQPTGAARAYLIVIDRNPKAVQSALKGKNQK